jgi:pilus assembly protein CpaC
MKSMVRIMLVISAFLLVLCMGGVEAFGQAPNTHSTLAIDVPSAANAKARLQLESSGATGKLHILVGQSMMLRGVSPMRRIYVGNPTILQTYTAGPEETVLTAKAPGISSLVIWDNTGQSCLYTVSADIDPAGLRQSLQDAYPNVTIEVGSSEDRLTLAGVVPTAEMSDAAAKLAAIYSKDVVNSLRVVPVHGKQVQLKLRIAEVDRSKLEQFGVNLTRAGNNIFGTSTQQFPGSTAITATPITGTSATAINVSDPLTMFFSSLSSGYGVSIQDLQQKNIVQILAEPNLTTLSGQPARFLSGGEFPFPVAQSGGAGSAPVITIQFKPFGVKVEFTPIVNADGTIHLKIAPEVSTLDFTNEVVISGFTIPALSTRRSETEIELKDGQTFALSGLLDRRTTDQLAKIPGIASIPFLGQFFRSKNLNHTVTELVMVVTASVVDPLNTPGSVQEPKFPVPFLNVDKYDKDLGPAKKSEQAH